MEQTGRVDETSSAQASQQAEGVLLGGLWVLAFSFTLPATRAAAPELGGAFVGLGRELIAAILAGLLLWGLRERFPARRHWPGFGLVALGVILGFPLCSALAMQSLPAAHGAVAIGLLPAMTALMGVLRAGERPSGLFWIVCAAGVLCVLAFAVSEGAGRPQPGDALLLLSVVLWAALLLGEPIRPPTALSSLTLTGVAGLRSENARLVFAGMKGLRSCADHSACRECLQASIIWRERLRGGGSEGSAFTSNQAARSSSCASRRMSPCR